LITERPSPEGCILAACGAFFVVGPSS